MELLGGKAYCRGFKYKIGHQGLKVDFAKLQRVDVSEGNLNSSDNKQTNKQVHSFMVDSTWYVSECLFQSVVSCL